MRSRIERRRRHRRAAIHMRVRFRMRFEATHDFDSPPAFDAVDGAFYVTSPVLVEWIARTFNARSIDAIATNSNPTATSALLTTTSVSHAKVQGTLMNLL